MTHTQSFALMTIVLSELSTFISRQGKPEINLSGSKMYIVADECH